MKKAKKLLLLLTLALSLALPASQPIPGIPGTTETVSAAVRINYRKLTVYIGQARKLAVTGTAKSAKWASSDKSVVTVDKKGKITGRGVGTAVITAKISKKKYTCRVTVLAYDGLTYKCIRVEMGETYPLRMDGDWKEFQP